MDMLARGVPLLVIPETTDIAVLTEIRLEEVLSGLRLTYAQFVDACMLMGSDYSGKDWPGMEPRRAIEVVTANKTALTPQLKQGVAILAGIDVAWDTIVSEKQRIKWDAGPPPCEPENVAVAVTAHGWPTTWATVLGCNS